MQVIDLVEKSEEKGRERKAAHDAIGLGIPVPPTSATAGDPLNMHHSSFSKNARRMSLPSTPNPAPKGVPRWFLPVAACTAYSITSLATTFSNKAIMNIYDFDYPLFLTIYQNAFVALWVLILSNWGAITVEPLEQRKVQMWMPANVAFVLMLVFSQLSLGRISVAMVTVFKNFATIAITLGDRIFFDNPISPSIAVSLAIMAGGSVVAGFNDLEYRTDGYIYLTLNCAFQASYILYMNKVMQILKLDKWSSMYYNNIIAIPMLIPCFLIFKELDTVFFSPVWSLPSFWALLFVNGACSFGISLCSFWAISVTTPTTYSMVGGFNKIPLTILGSVIFKTAFTLMGKLSVLVGLSGAMVYTWAKSKQQSEKRKLLDKQKQASP